MSRRKPRIVITIVTDDGITEYSEVKGALLANGSPSAGPSAARFKIAHKAIAALMRAP